MRERPDTRQRLIDATIEVLTTRGEAGLRITDITDAVGVTQPSIYHFFPSREDLVVAAYREHYRRSVATVTETFESAIATADSAADFVDGARRGLLFAMSDARSEIRRSRVLLLAKALTNATLLEELNDASLLLNEELAKILERAQAKGWIRTDVSPLTLAVLVRSHIFGRFVLELDRSRYDGDEWTELAIEATLSVFRPTL